MVRHIFIAALLIGSLWSLAAMTWPGVGPWGFAAATLSVPAILLGLARVGRRASWKGLAPALALFLLLQGAGWTLILTAPSGSLVGGLPLGAWILLVGFGVIPLPLLATWFALDPSDEP